MFKLSPVRSTASRRNLLRAALAVALGASSVVPARAQEAGRAAALLARVGEASVIDQGVGSHRLYVFFDPNCPYCHQLYLKLRPLLARHGVRVSWIVLGMLTPSSAAKAAAMLQAPDPLKAFEQNEDDYDFGAAGQAGGGIAPAAAIAPRTRDALARNLALYRSQRLFGVPILLWKRRDGDAEMFSGVPSAAQLEQILAGLA